MGCSKCQKDWMVGDKERTEEEKSLWTCPKCIKSRYCFCGKCGDETICDHREQKDHDISLCGSCL